MHIVAHLDLWNIKASELLSLFYSIPTPWSSVLEKLTSSQPVKKFHALFRTRRFIITRHLSLWSAASMQSMPTHPTSSRSILIYIIHCTVVIFYSYYRYVPHIRWLSHRILYKIYSTTYNNNNNNTYHCVTPGYSIQYSNMLYGFVA